MDYTLSRAVAAEIRAEQGRRQVTGKQLALRIGRPTTTVARWLRGDTPMTLDEIAAFAKALDVRTADLVERAMGRIVPELPPERRDPGSGSGHPKVTSAETWRMPSITLLPRAA